MPYGVWTPTWQLRVIPASGGTPTQAQVQWMVGEVNPVDPKHLVAGVDLQIDMGHGWQEVPDGPTSSVTIPATATYGSPYMFYFRFKPIINAQQAVRICATLIIKGAPASQSGSSAPNTCTDDLTFTGTPPQSAPSSPHSSTSAPGRSATPSRTTTKTTPPTTPSTTATPTPSATPTQTPAMTTSAPDTASSSADAANTVPTPGPTASASASPAAASGSASAWEPVGLGIGGVAIVGGVVGGVAVVRRRSGQA